MIKIQKTRTGLQKRQGDNVDNSASPQEVADYIASMLEALRDLAEETDFDFLVSLLDDAHQEAINERDRY